MARSESMENLKEGSQQASSKDARPAAQEQPSRLPMTVEQSRDRIAELEAALAARDAEVQKLREEGPQIEVPPNLPPAAAQHFAYVSNIVRALTKAKSKPSTPAVARCFEVTNERNIPGTTMTGFQTNIDGIPVVFHTGKLIWDHCYNVKELERRGLKLKEVEQGS